MSRQVVIVGAGPAGYATALGLAALGVGSTILEQNRTVAAGSRATGLSRRSLQLLTPSGAADRVMEIAIPQRANQAFVGTTELFLDWTPAEPGRYPRVVNIQQDLFEEVLVDLVARHPGIELRWGSRVDAVRPSGDAVELDVTGPDGPELVRAPWLVACDGARSAVRRAHGLSLRGVRYDTRFIVTDVRARLDVEPGVRRIWFDPPSNPGGTIIMHQQPRDVWRIDFGLSAHEAEDAALGAEGIRARVASHLQMFGVDDDSELVWSGDYTASSVSLDSYRHGRVFFAGDAAHLVPIFGGRGMNSAIEDGFNLAWRLAAVLRGGAPESLLDGYSDERREGAEQNSAKAGIGAEVIAARSRGSLVLRRAALGLMVEGVDALQPLLNHRTTDANTYTHGLLDGARPDGVPGAPEEAAADGLVVLPDGSRRQLSELIEPGFTVLEVAPDAAALGLPSTLDGLPRSLLGLPIGRLRVAAAPGPDGLPAPPAPGTALLRPDRYVVAAGPGETVANLLAATARLAGASAAEEAIL